MNEKLRIDQLDFKAGPWKWDARRKCYYSECRELVAGRWEGFVTIKNGKEEQK